MEKKGESSITSDVPGAVRMTITPDMACEFLENQRTNRNQKDSKIAAYAEDMRSGKWRLNGETIKFDQDGLMFDGQNRCWACIAANRSFETFVATGLDPSVMSTVDTGAARTFKDVLTISGEGHAGTLASAVRLVYTQEHGGFATGSRRIRPSHEELQTTLRRHARGLREALEEGHRLSNRLISGGFATFFIYRWGVTNGQWDDVIAFFESIKNVEDIHGPAAKLYEALSKDKETRTRRLGQLAKLALIAKAVGAAMEGRTIRTLVWRSGQKQTEKFPHVPGDDKVVKRKVTIEDVELAIYAEDDDPSSETEAA